MIKYCRDCGLSFEVFGRNHVLCRECANLRVNNKSSAYTLKYRAKHMTQYVAYMKTYQQGYRQTSKYKELKYASDARHWDQILLRNARKRAKQVGIEFNLEISDIVIPEQCPYLKVPLTRIRGQGQQPNNASLDRIDSSKGYIKGNVQVISWQANKMKTDATKDELLTFAQSILDADSRGR